VGNAGSRVGNLDARAEPTWPAQAFRRSQLCTCAGQRYCAAISGALSTRPNVTRVAGGFKEVSYYHRVTPCGLVTVHEGHPVRGGVARDGRQRWGSVHSGDEGTAGFRRAPVLTQVRSMGPVDPVLPRVARR